MHEDQLQAPVGEGRHLHVCLSAGDGGGGAPFEALVLGGGHQWREGLRNQGARGQEQGSEKPFLLALASTSTKATSARGGRMLGKGEALKASVRGGRGQAASP